MPSLNDVDQRYMDLALRLAERALGRVWPNPAVGCVLVKDGRIVGRGWTQPPPGSHAEVEALKRAGSEAMGATAYVTLEPCCHYGRTPPCTMAMIHAGIRRVFVARRDPYAEVDGRGIEQLRQARIPVNIGIRHAEAGQLNAGFIAQVQQHRPLVTLKIASSLDGRIATRTGASQWITGEAARQEGHRLRATHDAIMIGSNTAKADNPSLTCRLPGMEDRTPVRVILDSRLRLPVESRLAQTAARHPLWVVTSEGQRDRPELAALGVQLIRLTPDPDGRLPIQQVVAALAARGITRLLVEGGAALAASLLRQGLVDRLVWFQAPIVIGKAGRAAIETLDVDRLSDAPAFERLSSQCLATDTLATYITRKT